jgi:ribosomal protein S18 acetylase RimI-like enzyme
MDTTIQRASAQDIPALETLVNSAYRGEASQKGWTTEAHLLLGDKRTDAASLGKMLGDAQAVILTCKDATGALLGCVYLRQQPDGLYLGMLSVSPTLQGGGIGKKLIAAAEAFAVENQCHAIVMTVISVRKELIDWYQRLGYSPTGETQPFPVDGRYGIPTQPLEFVVLRKSVGNDER